MNKHLHIVCFDIPYPANYGGVIDIFYKLRALHQAGVQIHLHSFLYNRDPAPELEEFCTEIVYYKRKTGFRYNLGIMPYIVVSRRIPGLLKNLLKDDYPVLLEGLHTTAYLPELRKAGKAVFVRSHNIEHEYYRGLAGCEARNYRSLFFKTEALKLENYEPVLANASGIIAISPSDYTHFLKYNIPCTFIPAFHAEEKISIAEGTGEYALYHGNLEISENREAALWLGEKIFRPLGLPLVIAGKNPPLSLREAFEKDAHIKIISSPSDSFLQSLIDQAGMHVLPTFLQSGIKLKLIRALFTGRWVLTNAHMVENTGLEAACEVAQNEMEFREKVQAFWEKPFTEADIRKREALLQAFLPATSAQHLISFIFPGENREKN